jgi:deferrochelatase/peroxidase EfeB
MDRTEAGGPKISRRVVLGSLGAAAAVAGVGIGVTVGGTRDANADGQIVPFRGRHQAGIATPVQQRLQIAAFDLTAESVGSLRGLMHTWTDAAAKLCQGEPIGSTEGMLTLPPADTGEALGLSPSRLTITFGFGPTLFERHGQDRFGLASARPAALVDLPSFPHEELDPRRTGGDIIVQACSDDPQVAFHAIRNLARIGRDSAVIRWTQLGFGRTSSLGAQGTPRNLQGFKDGTNNLDTGDAATMARDVWVGSSDDPAWMRGGSYMVTRRIRMLIETWDRSSLRDQEQTIGRRKDTGAPLGRSHEFDHVPLHDRKPDGKLLIPKDAHIRLAAPAENSGRAILRRGYSFDDGIDPKGKLDAGLFFICFQRDPREQFIPIQRRLSNDDALNEYVRHVGSGIFAVPPGTTGDGYVGETLLG